MYVTSFFPLQMYIAPNVRRWSNSRSWSNSSRFMLKDINSFQMLTTERKNIAQLLFTDTRTWKSMLQITDTEMATEADTGHGLCINGKNCLTIKLKLH